MRKAVFLVILMTNFLYASSSSAHYDVGFSLLGTIAKASMTKVQEGDSYVITMEVNTVGAVAGLTKDREDLYISQGSVIGSEFVPDVLVVKRKSNTKEKYTVYRFNHIEKVVYKDKIETKKVRSQSLDILSLRIIYSEKEEFSFSSSKNDYYARNDIVSLLFNSHYYIDSMDRGEQKKFSAVGIKTDKGELLLSMPNKDDLIENNSFDIALNKDFFKNGKGRLVVHLDADGFPSQAIMNDVAFYGDVVGKRIYTKLVSK